MAYLATTATSTSDIIDSIQAFANTVGFTTEFHGNTPDTRRMVQLSGGGLSDYAHFFDTVDNSHVQAMRSISLSSGDNYNSQPERSYDPSTDLRFAGPYQNLYLFAETGANAYIHCVIERTAGIFRHFGIGEIIKTGTWTGGGYAYGTYWDTITSAHANDPTDFRHGRPFDSVSSNQSFRFSTIRCDDCDAPTNDVSGIDNRYLTTYTSETATFGSGAFYIIGGAGGAYTRMVGGFSQTHSPNYFNNRVILAPFGLMCDRASGFQTYLGEPPAIRAASIEPYTPGEEFTIGTDVWKIFPLVRKGSFTNEEGSQNYAIAYKKVT